MRKHFASRKVLHSSYRYAMGACIACIFIACQPSKTEQGLPSADSSGVEGIVKVPISGDGSMDTLNLPRLSFGERRYNFGNVDAGAIIEHRFPFQNTGKRALYITGANSTCGCTVPIYPREAIAPGDTSSIYVRFDTDGKEGPQDKVITLTANTYPNSTEIHMLGQVDVIN